MGSGEEFRTAFSCFVYSKEDPKGIDCIEKFKHMQDCFRLHPEVYGSELSSDDDEEGQDAPAAVEGGVTEEPQPITVQGTLEDNSRDRKPTEAEVAVDDRRLGEQLGTAEGEERKVAAEKAIQEEKKAVEEVKQKVAEEAVKTVPAAIGTPSIAAELEKKD